MTLPQIHDGLANATIMYCAIMAVWGFWRFFRKQGMGSSYFGAVVVAEILLLVQGVIGIILYMGAGRYQAGFMHWLYGIVLVLSAPVVFAYTKGRQERPEMLLYAVAYLIMIALVLRAMVTAGP
jgi:uncharacterized membrane protein HdeD (DUF308 family)